LRFGLVLLTKVAMSNYTACRYHECLVRIKSFRHVNAPVPGIQAAAVTVGGSASGSNDAGVRDRSSRRRNPVPRATR
jgi:hypothetical protein